MRWVFSFDELEAAQATPKGSTDPRGLLGGKGFGLAEMTRIGLPVPPGFTITTEACTRFMETNDLAEGLWDQVKSAIAKMEDALERKFGAATKENPHPMLVSSRSGAKFSMPGMMSTALNIGLNDEVAEVMCTAIDPRFVFDSYRRLISMFGSIVMDIADEPFEEAIEDIKTKKGYKSDTDLTADDMRELVATFKKIYKDISGQDFPQDPWEQLRLSIRGVFMSWTSKRAVTYRERENIPHTLGTAVNIVAMVFGNFADGRSGTGVAFTRNPSTGEKALMGEYLLNAQGEDVVAGIRNASPISQMEADLPEVYGEFIAGVSMLENHFRDMQDVEYTIERGKLWMLQTRTGKRTARAAIRIAVEMAKEGMITKKEALLRVKAADVDMLLHPQFDSAKLEAALPVASGVNASPGAAVGVVAFDADLVVDWKKDGKQVIMARPFTKPDDVHGLLASVGVVTSEGGATSHAAVVARQFGTPCICGASMKINLKTRTMTTTSGTVIKEGDLISIDGTSGHVYVGEIEMMNTEVTDQVELQELLKWADDIAADPNARRLPDGTHGPGLQVWANGDTGVDAKRARAAGARGIGLVRTEHMFFDPERLPIVRRMILSSPGAERQAALAELLPFQKKDFTELFEAMDGLPVIIRLIDPPLHEFLQNETSLLEELILARIKAAVVNTAQAQEEVTKREKLFNAIHALHESNPMTGLRGVRLSIFMPEIVEMQITALFEAAAEAKLRGIHVIPKVMIPLTGTVRELEFIQPRLETVAKRILKEHNVDKLPYEFGTMIETPRACITAGELAKVATFFSFGTNDLTQLTFGYSRDDAEKTYLMTYVENGILQYNPFQRLDEGGVGKLVKLAIESGRRARPKISCGMCGEHGGEYSSIAYFSHIGGSYVSCSPFRIPAARLAVAHVLLKDQAEAAKK